MRDDLLRWQHETYHRFHKDKLNLWLHLAAVPMFWVGSMLLLSTVFLGTIAVPVALAFMAASLATQAYGHRREAEPSIPFDGPFDALSRLLVEQLVTFPRFLNDGGWVRALHSEPNARELASLEPDVRSSERAQT